MSQIDQQVQLDLPSKVTAGKSFIVLDEVENAGNDPSPRSVTGFCLSEDDVCGEKDLRLGPRPVPPSAGASDKRRPVPTSRAATDIANIGWQRVAESDSDLTVAFIEAL